MIHEGGGDDQGDLLLPVVINHFQYNHMIFFKTNPCMKVMINHIDHMGAGMTKERLRIANDFLQRL